jgi:shikimate kinase
VSKNLIVILVGPPGSGKTTTGQYLASHLGWQFVDTDALIAESCGCSIAELFEKRGEPYFRNLESETLRQLIDDRGGSPGTAGIVIGTGGGIVVSEENRVLLQSVDSVCYLTADVDVLVDRLSGDATRPLLKTNGENSSTVEKEDEQMKKRVKLKNLLDSRRAAYEEARFKIDTGGLTIEGVASEILRLLNLQPLPR